MNKIREFKYSSLEEYLSRYIDIFSILYLPEESWLLNREKDFFIACIKLNSQGKDLLGKEAKAFLEGELKVNSRVYRSMLKKKGWVIQTPTGVKIMPAFDYKGEIPKDISLRFKISYNDSKNRESV